MPSFMFRSGQDKWSEVQVIHVDETTKRRPIGALSAGSHPPGSTSLEIMAPLPGRQGAKATARYTTYSCGPLLGYGWCCIHYLKTR